MVIAGLLDEAGLVGENVALGAVLGGQLRPESDDMDLDRCEALGTTDAGGLPALSELADLAGSGDLHIPIAATYPLTAVQDAYRVLASRKAHGRIVLHPQDLT